MRKLKSNFLLLSFVLLSIFLIPSISISQSYIEINSDDTILDEYTVISDQDLFEVSVDESTSYWESNIDKKEPDDIYITGSFTTTDFAQSIYDYDDIDNVYWERISTFFFLKKESEGEIISQPELYDNFWMEGQLSQYDIKVYIDGLPTYSGYHLNFQDDDFKPGNHTFTINVSIPYNEYYETSEWEIDPTVEYYYFSFISNETLGVVYGFIDEGTKIRNPYYDRTIGIDTITPTIDPIVPDDATNLLWLWILLPILLLIILVGIAILIFYKKKN